MSSLNQCNFIGRLGADPDTRYAASGVAVTNISIACSEQWTDKESGERKERTEWIRITAFGKLAEIIAEYLVKGGQVYVSGRMQTDKYEDKEGIERYSTKIIADKMVMLGSKGERESGDTAKKESRRPAERQGFVDDDIPI